MRTSPAPAALRSEVVSLRKPVERSAYRGLFLSRIKLGFSSIGYIVARLQKRLTLNSIYKSSIHPTSKIEPGSQIVNSSFGRHSFCGYNCTIINAEIGAFCSLAQDIMIGGSTHPIHFVSTSPAFLSHRDSIKTKFARHHYHHQPRTTIGSDVWIGARVLIKAGVKIGHGAVIGMGSVVTRDVAPYTIVAGNPARLIRPRFAPEVIDALLRSEWWNASDDDLQRYGSAFNSPEEFLKMKNQQ